MAKTLTDMLGCRYPVLMAPMFLVSDENLMLAGLENGVAAAFPAANYRSPEALDRAMTELKSKTNKPFGVNIIANRSNPDFDTQLSACIKHRVDFVITSLGNPEIAINACHKAGIPVFCDVTDLKYAKKVVGMGADALIAVNKQAGGHPGLLPGDVLLTELQNAFDLPVIYAGGIASHTDYQRVMKAGAAGVSVGTLFLATKESPVSDAYKQAMVNNTAKDIVLTDKLSGAPLHVINTDYVKKTGTKANRLTCFLYRHKKLRRFLKGLAMKRGMKALEKAAFSASYKTVWVAGPAISNVHSIVSVKERVEQIIGDKN
ncbi:MAG TPA: nitronate monooxygenase [Bacteroidales bacterium]|nr:nitronate monooxygenase [Bacteroidales bacterium]